MPSSNTQLMMKERTRHISSSGGGDISGGYRSAVGGVAVDGAGAGVDRGVTSPSGAGAGGPAASLAVTGSSAASPAGVGGPAASAGADGPAGAGVEATAPTSVGTGKGYDMAVAG